MTESRDIRRGIASDIAYPICLSQRTLVPVPTPVTAPSPHHHQHRHLAPPAAQRPEKSKTKSSSSRNSNDASRMAIWIGLVQA